MLTVEIQGVKELQSAFRRSPEIVKSEVEPAIKKTIITLIRYAILNFSYLSNPVNPKTPRTGFMMGVGRGLVDSYGPLIGRLENVAPYAGYVHGLDGYGWSRPYAPRPFFNLAIEQSQQEVGEFWTDALTNITRKLAE